MAATEKSNVEYLYVIAALGVFQVWYACRFTNILSKEVQKQLLNDSVTNKTKPAPIFILHTEKKLACVGQPAAKEKSPGIYQILSWNENELIFPKSQSIFPFLNCSVNNCVFFKNEHYERHEDYLYFDAIIFNERDLFSLYRPEIRNSSQLYVFHAHEPLNMASCDDFNDFFFNWTLTYRLDSTVIWNYLTIRSASGGIVAPKIDYRWLTDRKPVKREIRSLLMNKKKAVVWIMRKKYCSIISYVDEYVALLKKHLESLNLTLDIYGTCSGAKCDNNDCDAMIKRDYYFYIAFESRYAPDYVTDVVQQAYKGYAVPIVHGGANYFRFLPPDSFLNAVEIRPDTLAIKIREIIKNRRAIENYFYWTNLYTIGFESSDHPLCGLCAALNKPRERLEIVSNFKYWWNGLEHLRWCPESHYWKDDE